MAPQLRAAVTIALTLSSFTALAQVRDAAAPPPANLARISGVVTNTDTPPQPIGGALVLLSSEAGPGAFSPFARVTDEQGRFAFDVAAGRYQLSAKKPAHLETHYGAMRAGAAGTALALTAGQTLENIALELPRGGVITGTITDLRGRPAANIMVTASTTTGMQYMLNGVSTLTDDRGAYRIFGLQPDDYYLIATHLLSTTIRQAQVVTAQQVDAALAELERAYNRGGASSPPPAPRPAGASNEAPPQIGDAITLFPGTPDAGTAVLVTVGAGEVREGVDFPLVLAGGASINGVVVDGDGRPVPNALVSIVTFSASGERSFVARGSSAADGAFRIANVSPGRQTVLARLIPPIPPAIPGTTRNPEELTNRPIQWATADVDVSGLYVYGVTLALEPSMTFAGRVVFDGASPPSPAAAQVNVVTMGAHIVRPKADGTFLLNSLLPGPARITATAAGWRARSIMFNGRNLLDFPLDVDPNGGNISDVVITFTNRRTQLTGTLQTPAGSPAPNYFVVIFPANRQLWHARSERMAATRPGTDGRFEFADLPAGDYRLVALTDLNPDTWKQTAFLDPLVTSGLPVALVEGESKVQNLRIAQ